MTDGLHPNELIHEVISYELLKIFTISMVKKGMILDGKSRFIL